MPDCKNKTARNAETSSWSRNKGIFLTELTKFTESNYILSIQFILSESTAATNTNIRRGTRAEEQTERFDRRQLRDTRRFCLRNSGSRFFRCRDRERNRD